MNWKVLTHETAQKAAVESEYNGKYKDGGANSGDTYNIR